MKPSAINIKATIISNLSNRKERKESLNEIKIKVTKLAVIICPAAQIIAILTEFLSDLTFLKRLETARRWSGSKLCFIPKTKARRINSNTVS